MRASLRSDWPVLTCYDKEFLARVALPLGGIGTGTVSLGGRGNLLDWEIGNRPDKGFRGGDAFFVLHCRPDGRAPVTRLLEGVLQAPYDGWSGATAPYHGLPRFRECSFHSAYPLAQILLSDEDVPLGVRLEAFNPFVPADADKSGHPVAVLRYVLQNSSDRPIEATVCGSIRNFIGTDGDGGAAVGNVNRFVSTDELRGLLMTTEGLPESDPRYGTIALTTTAPDTTHQLSWSGEKWHGELVGFWDDLRKNGRLTERDCPPQDAPMGSLAATVTVPAHGEAPVSFLLTWHFPNRQTWTPCQEGDDGSCACDCGEDRIGNYYTTKSTDAWTAATSLFPQLDTLQDETVQFVRAFTESDLPAPVKEAALCNLSTLRTQTCFRTEDGRFFGWEGCCDDRGCCHGSCTHVWNYEQATPFLFGDLSRSMREVEFLHATDDRGHMSFRVHLPLPHALDYGLAAADGQMGCIIKVYRDWQLYGDTAWLRSMWPKIKSALAFCWVPGGWDADQDGVMEGCQHNTLDVEYYGPNPLMGAWYLGALRAAEEMAIAQGEETFAAKCSALFHSGSAWLDQHLFNGEYYEQQILPPRDGQLIADGLRSSMGADALGEPDFQIGPGCLVDQLVGQLLAHVCALGYLLDPRHVRATLNSIRDYNGRDDLYGHFNPMRTFALNDERALVMCSFPKGGRPRRPVPYYAEIMTGFEYAANVHMLYEGQIEAGLDGIAATRARYDGQRRNPFDEAECGHHYARAMTSWAAVLALTGFHYSAVDGIVTFAANPGLHFWSSGYAWGTCEIGALGDTQASQSQVSPGSEITISLKVLHGSLKVQGFVLTTWGRHVFSDPLVLTKGEGHSFTVRES